MPQGEAKEADLAQGRGVGLGATGRKNTASRVLQSKIKLANPVSTVPIQCQLYKLLHILKGQGLQ